MFTKDKTGNKCWSWEGINYAVSPHQTELYSGRGWSFHFHSKGSEWTNYRLYTAGESIWKSWSISVNNGVFSRSAYYRKLKKNHPQVLEWLMAAIEGKAGPFPSEGFIVNNQTRLFRKPEKIPVLRPGAFPSIYKNLLAMFAKAAASGAPLCLKAGPQNAFTKAKGFYGASSDLVRDFIDEMTEIGIMVHSPDGFRVKDASEREIYTRLEVTGVIRRRCAGWEREVIRLERNEREMSEKYAGNNPPAD